MKKAKYGEFLKLNMGKNTILSFFPHIKEACSLVEQHIFNAYIVGTGI